MSSKKPEEVLQIVQDAVGKLGDDLTKEAISKNLITPYVQLRTWDYGADDEELLPCWVFLEFKETKEALAYSESAFGALGAPWGFVQLEENHFNMDSFWHSTLDSVWKHFGSKRSLSTS